MKMLCLIIILLSIIILEFLIYLRYKRAEKKLQTYIERIKNRGDILSKWLYRRDADMYIADELKKRGIKKIAIYGMAEYGIHLIGELKKTDIEIAYVVDRSDKASSCGCRLLKPSDTLDDVDAMIITVSQSYNVIQSEMSKKLNTVFFNLIDLI